MEKVIETASESLGEEERSSEGEGESDNGGEPTSQSMDVSSPAEDAGVPVVTISSSDQEMDDDVPLLHHHNRQHVDPNVET